MVSNTSNFAANLLTHSEVLSNAATLIYKLRNLVNSLAQLTQSIVTLALVSSHP